MKRLIFAICYFTGIVALFRFLNRNRLTIVLYHDVIPRDMCRDINRRMLVTAESFDSQLDYLKKHFTVLPLDEAFEKMRLGTLPPRSLSITFDDGYRNNFLYAYPLLKKYALTATFFLATDFVFEKKPLWIDRLKYAVQSFPGTKVDADRRYDELSTTLKHVPEREKYERLHAFEKEVGVTLVDFEGDRWHYAPLEKSDIEVMQHGGMTFGAHTRTHPILAHVSEEESSEEIAGSQKIVARECGSLSGLFCYPNGQRKDFTDQIVREVREAGFSGAVTTIEGTNSITTDPYALHRIGVDNIDTTETFAAAVSGLRARVRTLARSRK